MRKTKERPILFNAEMVRAILDGRKTQTRRMMKVQPQIENPKLSRVVSTTGDKKELDKLHWISFTDCGYGVKESGERYFTCPYGQVGDMLWVRETFQPIFNEDIEYPSDERLDYKTGSGYLVSYRATDGVCELLNRDDEISTACTPSIHMPRWASRITLEITDIRVERLNEISQSDAIAEGAPKSHPSIDQVSRGFGYADFSRSWFAQLFESINGAGSWTASPWVWVISFKRIEV